MVHRRLPIEGAKTQHSHTHRLLVRRTTILCTSPQTHTHTHCPMVRRRRVGGWDNRSRCFLRPQNLPSGMGEGGVLSSWQADQHTRSVRCFPLASRGLSRRPSCARALRTIIVRRSLGRAVVLEPSLRVLSLLRRAVAHSVHHPALFTPVFFSLLPVAFTLGSTLFFSLRKSAPPSRLERSRMHSTPDALERKRAHLRARG